MSNINLSKTETLSKALVPASDAFLDELEDTVKKAAVNMLLMLGPDRVLAADGYFISAVKLAEANLAWMLSEGYVTLTDKALADDEERATHEEAADKVQSLIKAAVEGPSVHSATPEVPGQYL